MAVFSNGGSESIEYPKQYSKDKRLDTWAESAPMDVIFGTN